MKRILVFLLVILSFSLCGFTFKLKKDKPVIVLSTAPVITKDDMTRTENVFKKGQRVSMLFYFPEGFGDSVLRMTLFKLSDKTNTLGFEPVRSRHVPVTIGDKYFSDYFVIYQSGIYQIQFVEVRKPRRILSWARFKVE